MKLRFLRSAVAASLGLVVTLPALADPKIIKAPAATVPVDIAATYAINLNGFNLGRLVFNAHVGDGTYTADSDVAISALLGAFKWHGVTRTAGTLSSTGHKPQAFNFEYQGTSRSGSVAMRFSGSEVSSLNILPATYTSPDTVPLERKHLKDALDPLSAILALVRVEGSNPCSRKIGIFDGKQRFDLALSFRRNEVLPAYDNQPGATLVVCKVKYTPVAGYRMTGDTKSLAESNDIEIAFRRIARSPLAIPHRVSIPTMAGVASIEAERVSISGGRGEVALAD